MCLSEAGCIFPTDEHVPFPPFHFLAIVALVLPTMSERPTRPVSAQLPRYTRLERLSVLLDSSIRVPFTNFRFGLDALLGLVPGLGDVVGLLLAVYIVFEAGLKFKVPRATLLRMAFNVAIDALSGTVPVIGDVFDAAYKANRRNVELLREHVGADPAKQEASDRRFVWGVLLVLVLTLAGIGALIFLIGWGVVQLLEGT